MLHINGSLACQILVKYVWKGLWICGKVHLCPYTNLVLLWINIAQNQNCLTVFGESLLCRISVICETVYGKHVKVHYDHM
jgi:hypothetical protein